MKFGTYLSAKASSILLAGIGGLYLLLLLYMTSTPAPLISLVVLGVYVLYFFLTYRIACDHVICRGGDRDML